MHMGMIIYCLKYLQKYLLILLGNYYIYYELTGLGEAVSEHAPQFLAHCICGEDLLKLNRQKLEYLQVFYSYYLYSVWICTYTCIYMHTDILYVHIADNDAELYILLGNRLSLHHGKLHTSANEHYLIGC